MVSIITAQLCHCITNAAMKNTRMYGLGCIPVKLDLQKRGIQDLLMFLVLFLDLCSRPLAGTSFSLILWDSNNL